MPNRILSALLSFTIILTLILSVSSPIIAGAEGETVLISSADDLVSFAKSCSYDLWSKGKSFLLTQDIDLSGVEFDSVPVFSGKFNGNGHTISGLNLTSAGSPMGLFSILESDGEIRNLTLLGAVTPEGDAKLVGGIVGENRGLIENSSFGGSVVGTGCVGGIAGVNTLTGSIIGCQSTGDVVGDNTVGGIVGRNEGLISSSTSSAKVNTIAVSPTLSLDQINLSLTLDITKLPDLGKVDVSDVGGIAGYSSGIILGAVNNGRVGYPHIGYNVGGIVGRNSGHVSGCKNNAEVFGRKDVGGIVGQMEPHVNYELSENLLSKLKSELDRLNAKVGEALGSADGNIPTIGTRLDNIITNLDGATNSLHIILGDLGDLGNESVTEINRVSAILKETLTQLSAVTDALPELAELLSSGLYDLEDALDELDAIAIIGITSITDLAALVEDGTLAIESIRGALDNLSDGLTLMKDALEIKDQAKAEAAIDGILDSLLDVIEATGNINDRIGETIDAARDNAWMDSALNEAEKLAASLGKSAEAVLAIYDAVLVIKENLNLNWSRLESASGEMAEAIDRFAEAIENMDTALALMESGLIKMTDGMEGLINSVSVNDEVAAKEAAKKLTEGLDDLISAIASGSQAFENISKIISDLENGESISSLLGDISDAFDKLSTVGSESAEAFTTIAANLKTIFDNVKINIDSLSSSSSLVMGGMQDMTASLRELRQSISNMKLGMQAIDNAMEALGKAVETDDETKIAKALEDLIGAIGTLTDCGKEISDTLSNTVDIMREAKLWGDGLLDSLSALSDAIGELTDSMTMLGEGVNELRDNLSLDFDSLKSGFEKIILAISDTSDALTHVKDASLHLSDLLVKAEDAGEAFSRLTKKLSDAVGVFAKAMQKAAAVSEDIHTLIKYLTSVDPVQLPTAPESLGEEADRLFIYISRMESELKKLNSEATSMSSELIDILGDINDIFDALTENIVDAIYGLESGDAVDNKVLEGEIDGITHGRILSCENYGKVEGDINVGGISGAMGIEYTLDPEDDLSPELSATQKAQYSLKAVIHASKNYGAVTSKYDCAGGIAGKMDFGLIYLCENYGDVDSQSGDYVGGVAGLSAGRISASFAKCILAGGKYVGGIIGSGVSESTSGSSSTVVGCYTMVEIKSASQYYGAIGGVDGGIFEENYFISDSLAGIDRVSFGGRAEPIGYEELIKRRVVPDGFYGFVLKFVADGVVLSTLTFQYGESVDASAFPVIPTKDGHYGVWDRTDLSNLTFDTVVSVVYTPYVTTIAGGNRGEGDRNVFLVEGEFRTEDSLSASKGEGADGIELNNGLFVSESLVESWTLTIPKDTKQTNRVHFLPSTDKARIFLKLDGQWQEVNSSEFGSYLIFEVSADTVEIAVVRHTVKLVPIIIISAVALIAIAGVAVVMIIRKKKKA